MSSFGLISLSKLNYNEHCTLSAVNHLTTTKAKFGVIPTKFGVSSDMIYASLKTSFYKDPAISHIPPTFKNTSELRAVLEKLVKGKLVKFDKSKNQYFIDIDKFNEAKAIANWTEQAPEPTSSSSSSSVGESAAAIEDSSSRDARQIVVRGLFKLHTMASDSDYKLCHSFPNICYVTPLSGKIIAKTLHSLDGVSVPSRFDEGRECGDTTQFRIRKIQAKSNGPSIIATKDWFWGIEKGEGKPWISSFEEQADEYIAVMRQFYDETAAAFAAGQPDLAPKYPTIKVPRVLSTTKTALLWRERNIDEDERESLHYDNTYETFYISERLKNHNVKLAPI